MTHRISALTQGLALLASSVSAETMEEICASQGGLAESIMTNRQQGQVMTVLLAQLKELSEEDGGGGEDFYDAAKYFVLEAYKEPRWSSPERQAGAILDFRNQIEHDCFTGD